MYRVLGVRVDAVQIPGVIARMEEWIAARDRCRFIAVIDMHSVMEAWHAASFKNLALPMLLPGITLSTSDSDFAPIKQMQLMKFDGKTWKLYGDVISGSGF